MRIEYVYMKRKILKINLHINSTNLKKIGVNTQCCATTHYVSWQFSRRINVQPNRLHRFFAKLLVLYCPVNFRDPLPPSLSFYISKHLNEFPKITYSYSYKEVNKIGSILFSLLLIFHFCSSRFSTVTRYKTLQLVFCPLSF